MRTSLELLADVVESARSRIVETHVARRVDEAGIDVGAAGVDRPRLADAAERRGRLAVGVDAFDPAAADDDGAALDGGAGDRMDPRVADDGHALVDIAPRRALGAGAGLWRRLAARCGIAVPHRRPGGAS